MMVKYFDLNSTGCLKYDEMIFIILPCTDTSIIKKNKIMKYSSYVKSQIINEAKYLLRSEAMLHQTLEKHKQELGLKDKYDFKAAFIEIIEVNGMEEFIKNNLDISISKELTNAILRRIDSTGDGKINFQDFIKFLKPINDHK
mmetsp:Transcript_8881/g.7861  ORF Transcript_8881/g.7861 Transcript_8881/m.7861 type:complete len:143 (-) Transcript_8881:1178-1606(-)